MKAPSPSKHRNKSIRYCFRNNAAPKWPKSSGLAPLDALIWPHPVGGNDYFVALDRASDLFIADPKDTFGAIAEVTPDGIITTVAGSGPPSAYPGDNQGGFSGDGGPATDAQLKFSLDVAVDDTGNVYIADTSNDRIRRVSADGIITTIAGNGIHGYSGDGGLATGASLSLPHSLAVDGAGNIYVGHSENNAIRILTERPSCKVSWLRDRDTLRVYQHDLIEAHIRPSVAFRGTGIVNNADKQTLVIDSVRLDYEHARRSTVLAPADGAGGFVSG